MIGGDKSNRVIGPVGHMAGVMLASRGSRRKAVFFVAKPNHADLVALAELMEAGKVTTAIDRRYELAQLPEALGYFGEGHARAKVVIAVPS